MRAFTLKDIPEVNVSFPDLAGKTVLITGGERGIGQGIATFLGRQGMKLVIVGRSEEDAEVSLAELGSASIETHWFNVDVSDSSAFGSVVDEVVARLGRIHLLVNNAVRNQMIDYLSYDDDVYHLTFEHNMRMVHNASLACGKHMADEGGGAIVSLSSVGGRRAHRRSVGYDATKGAIDAMTRAMALDLAPHNIRVNSVAPGAIINQPVLESQRERREQQARGIPLGRVGSVSDVAALVGFLASEGAAYITGQTIYVDGGLIAQLTPPGIYI